MTGFKKKHSNVDYIGEIPSNWTVKKMKYLLKHPLKYGANETGEDYNEDYPRYIRITDINEQNQLKDEGKLSLLPEIAKPYILKNGDILFARSGATVGKSFFYLEKYGLSAFAGYLIKASFNTDIAYPKYVYYSTLGHGYENWKNNTFTKATIQNISADKYNAYKIPVPFLVEQSAIVSYLDDKCLNLDCIIKNLENQIEIAEKYKKSVITEAVTKGLNPDVEMKDCGVDWIGMIPKRWSITRTKYRVRIMNGKEILNEDGEIPVYGSGGLFKYTDKWLHEGMSVLLGRKGTVDAPQLVDGKFWTVDTAFYTSMKNEILVEYFYYLACCFDYEKYQTGSTVPSMTQTALGNIYIPKAGIDEQKEIVCYLDKKCNEIDVIIADKKSQLETIKKYKNSLIYEYVTGKKRVEQGAVHE